MTKTSLGEADITRKCGLYATGPRMQPEKQPIVVSASSPTRRKTAPDVPTRRVRRQKYDPAQFRALYDEGHSDYGIAREMGCGQKTVLKWRHKAGLPPNGRRYAAEPDTVRRLWSQGLNDPQIAERIGASRQLVQKVRAQLGLATHNPKAGRRTP